MSRNAPYRSLRSWLRNLDSSGRLAAMREGVSLKHELAAVAKCLDGSKSTWFPRPGGFDMSVVSGVISDRGWMAEALGISASDLAEYFAKSSASPIPWQEVAPGIPQREQRPPDDAVRAEPTGEAAHMRRARAGPERSEEQPVSANNVSGLFTIVVQVYGD